MYQRFGRIVLRPTTTRQSYLSQTYKAYNFVPASTLFSRSIMTKISDAVKTDHRELKEYYDKIVHANHMEEQVRYQNQFVWELARHSIAEELVLYPALEKHLGSEGKVLADRDRREHYKVSAEYQIMPLVHHNLSFFSFSKEHNLTWETPGERGIERVPKHETFR